ncbi:MAG: hypothetical protein ACK4GT_17280 [Pararhodobacter sp.]
MEWMLLLFPVAFLALTSLGDDGDEPEPDEISPGEFTRLSDGPDTAIVDDPDFWGHINGGDGDDHISVTTDDERGWRALPHEYYNGNAPVDMPYQGGSRWYDPRTDKLVTIPHDTSGNPVEHSSSPVMPGLTEIQGGNSDDTIIAAGTDMWIDGGPGADLIDASNLQNGLIVGDAEDTTIGSAFDISTEPKLLIVRRRGLQVHRRRPTRPRSFDGRGAPQRRRGRRLHHVRPCRHSDGRHRCRHPVGLA